RASIDANVGLTTELSAKANEFIGSEVVAFFFQPRGVRFPDSVCHWANSVLPVILRSKIPSRPTQDRNSPIARSRQDILADALGVRSRRTLFEYATIHDAADMFD